MLIDDVAIHIQAGNGGKGAATFLHLSGKYKGGPSGGNGGNGGDIYFQGTDDLTALQQFQFKKTWKAENGIAGQHKNLFGRNGNDVYILVPLGTRIIDVATQVVYEIHNRTEKILLAKGGRGGRGNNSFKSATNQAPHYAENGEAGEEKDLHLELRLIADVGFVGLPNAGKSSLLAVLTNANPKIGNYPFTTLEPNLGVMEGIILADIPGLIEGASSGKGLGFQFLKHIEKTRVLIHCIDITNEDLGIVYTTVREEFKKYSSSLSKKKEIVFLTKSDLLSEKQIKEKVKTLEKIHENLYVVSIYKETLLREIKEIIKELIISSI